MSLGVITIDDAGIAFASASGSRDHSPGYAVLDGRELRFGAQAMARARLDPRRSFDRFWEQLDQQPLPRPAGPAHSHADLAYFHLHALWQAQQSEADEVLLAVSAGFEADQLALLVGIAKACGIPVAGLVAAPVTAAATLSAAGPYLLLQAGIHRMQAAAVLCDNGLGLGERRSVVRRGLAELNQQWASMVAKAFVHDSRFDPLQAGASEQPLY
ncbi:MAG: hypothetical protein L0H19_03255, partial [Salinisphaera sp.]|nr:hypothetical protein [Salinisphaera sp.]